MLLEAQRVEGAEAEDLVADRVAELVDTRSLWQADHDPSQEV